MKRRSALLLLAAAVLAAAAASAATDWAPGTRVPGRVVITLRPGMLPEVAKSATGVRVDVPALQALAERFAVRDMSRLYEGFGAPRKAGEPDMRLVWAVDFPEEQDLDAVLAAYRALPEVARADAVDICRLAALPNDPDLNQQYYLRNLVLGGKDVRALGGWAEGTGDSTVIIAIVDSGVDWRHPDLGGTGPNYRRGVIWTNWEEVIGTTGIDDDGNGKIDDTRGWDFVTGVTGAPGQDVSVPDNDPSDFESHGTACAGVASAITNNGVGIAGTAWGCKIMPVRVGWLPPDSEVGVVRMDFASQGMVYAAANGARIINCSWGSTEYLSTAVDFCVSQGAIVVSAAGNDNSEAPESQYLVYDPDVLAVAATDGNDVRASFSNFGWWVELAAPGVGMYTTWFIPGSNTHTYATVQGTSFSSPLACGALGLIWSVRPTLNRAQVISLILSSADNIDAQNPGFEGKLGAGRVNLLRALGNGVQEVPDEFPTMLDAMNEAAPGDTVAVGAATVLMAPVTIANKALAILGGWNAGFTSRDPVGTPTLISANLGGTGLQFQGGTGQATVVDGFRITGGGGQIFASPQLGRYGGAVFCNGTSPTLRNLDVTGNEVGSTSEFGGGGGVVLINSSAVLEDCRIHGNTATHGAGVYAYLGAPTLRRCLIYDNVLRQDTAGFAPRGGGLYVTDASLTLEDSEIRGHADSEAGGGVYAANHLATTSLALADNVIRDNTARLKGGGLYMGGTTITMKRDLLHDNGQAAGASFMNGGGFMIENATASLDSVTSRDNDADVGGGGAIGGGPGAVVRHSVFTGNAADLFGGGLSYQSAATGEIAGNTIAFNSGGLGAGGCYIGLSSPAVTANIIASNTGGATFGNGLHANAATPALTCNDAWNNAGGNYSGLADPTGTGGNISLDPKFCEAAAGNYAIDAASPCAPAHSGGCGLIGALGVACSATGVDDGPPAPALVFRVEPAAPNPFNPSTAIRFSIPAAARTAVRVYDLAGRLVRTLVDTDLPAAAHVATWDGRDDGGRACSSGVYFYRVVSGEYDHTGRMAMVK